MGAHSYVHFIDTPIYIFIMQRFIFVEKKNYRILCMYIHGLFLRLQNLLNLHIYKCHIYLTHSVVFVWGLFTYF